MKCDLCKRKHIQKKLDLSHYYYRNNFGNNDLYKGKRKTTTMMMCSLLWVEILSLFRDSFHKSFFVCQSYCYRNHCEGSDWIHTNSSIAADNFHRETIREYSSVVNCTMMFPMLRCHCVLKTTIVFLAVQPVSCANVNEKTSGTTDGANVSSGLDQSSVYMILKDHSETQKKKATNLYFQNILILIVCQLWGKTLRCSTRMAAKRRTIKRSENVY